MRLYGGRKLGPVSVNWSLSSIPHPTFGWGWELDTMWFDIGIGDGNSDDIVSACFTVPAPIVRLVNRLAGY